MSAAQDVWAAVSLCGVVRSSGLVPLHRGVLSAERGLVSCAMRDPGALSLPVQVDDFQNPRLGELWGHLLALPRIEEGWLTAVLIAAWDWQDVDETARIAGLVPSALAAEYYAEQVRVDAQRRRVRLAAVRLVEDLDNGVETEEALGVFNANDFD